MRKFEYKLAVFKSANSTAQIEHQLNVWGAQGWEALDVNYTDKGVYVAFRREVIQLEEEMQPPPLPIRSK